MRRGTPKYANPAAPKPAHCVLTNHLIDEAASQPAAGLDSTISFLREQLTPVTSPSNSPAR
jgi:hypothetical protein